MVARSYSRLIWATFIMLAVVAFGVTWSTAKADTVPVVATVTAATALSTVVDLEPDGGLYLFNGGFNADARYRVSSADGSVTILSGVSTMDPIGGGEAGQLTVSGTPNASFNISAGVAVPTGPISNSPPPTLLVGNAVIPDNTDVSAAPAVAALDGSGVDVIRLGFEFGFAQDNPPAGTSTITFPVTVNYL